MSAEEILEANSFMTLATADAEGRPWASPVWFAYDGAEVFWVSRPGRRHSRNIAERPEVAIVVFDSSVEPGGTSAVYMEARAEQLTGADRDRALEVFSERSVRVGLEAMTLADIEAEDGLRLYRATVSERWLHGPRDDRIPAPLP